MTTMVEDAPALTLVPPVRFRIERGERQQVQRLIAYSLPADKRIGVLDLEAVRFGPGIHPADKAQIARAIHFAFRHVKAQEFDHVRAIQGHAHWYSLRRMINSYLPIGDRIV